MTISKTQTDMKIGQSNTWLCPAVELYEVGDDRLIGKPKVIFVQEAMDTLGRTNTPDLAIVRVQLHHPLALAQAIQISKRQNERVLLVAVLQLDESLSTPAGAESRELHGAFDAVFVVDVSKSEQLVRRLVRAITSSVGPDQFIGCDWNDVCHIVRGSTFAQLGYYGFGWSLSKYRATEATAAAIEQIASQGGRLRDARGLCVTVTAAPTTLYGREIKEVMRQIRAEINSAVNIIQCIRYDNNSIDGRMDVDVFAFGKCDVAALTMEQTNHTNKPPVAGHGIKSILNWRFSDPDPLYDLARSIILSNQRASISLVQRHLRIGYQRASRLLDAMEGDILSVKNEDGIRTVVVAC